MYDHVRRFRSVCGKIMANPLVIEELSADEHSIDEWIDQMCKYPTRNIRQSAHREWIRTHQAECIKIVKELLDETRMRADA